MGPKKKDGADGEDLSCEKFYAKYKKDCKAQEIVVSKQVTERYVDATESGENVTKLSLWDELGWQGVKVLMEAFISVKYQHLRSLRLWNTACEDEGCRAVCNYIKVNPTMQVLELMQNNITQLGCQFLGNMFNPSSGRNALINVKIDHNPIGSEGMKHLSEGLKMNKDIQNLSLTYCNIDETGARYIFELLLFQGSTLEEIDLGGNHLRNDGTIMVLRGAAVAKSLKKLGLQDNQFMEEDKVLSAIDFCMKKNLGLGKYNFKYNFISDHGVEAICTTLGEANHVYEVEIPERISKATMELFQEAKAANKPKKGGKGGKGKKKKK